MNKSITQAIQNDKQISKSILRSEHCYENKTRSQKLNLDNKCFQQL